MNIYDIGDQVRMECLLKDYDGALTSGTVTCEVKDSAAVVTAPATTAAGTGTYHAFFTTVLAGTHYYRFESVGATIAAGEGSFEVRASNFP